EIQRYLEVLSGRVYMEGGDVWYGDPHYHHGYDFCQLFNILAVSDWIGSLSHVSGENGTFTQSMVFVYSGENNSIDRIHPDSGSILIFKRTANNLNCGVAAGNRTVGLSFELSGLDDGSPPSTKTALIDSIMQYFGISPTGIEESRVNQFIIAKCIKIYPNPARRKVTMEFSGFTMEEMKVNIYDVSGRLVKKFSEVLSRPLEPTCITWDGTDEHGDKLPNGVYFLKLKGENYDETEKVILLR
ncbi:MAG: T9SS type A sorting domain-containing protein, partial [bacterium]